MNSASVVFGSKPPFLPFPASTRSTSPCSTAVRCGRLHEAVAALETGATIDPGTYTRLLQSCIDSDAISVGRRLHARIGSVKGVDHFVQTKLVSMYAKCGSLDEARRVFEEMPERNIFTWSAMIGGCARESSWEDVVALFRRMMLEGFTPDAFLLPMILQACANLEDVRTGVLLHSIAVRSGALLEPDRDGYVSNSILGMYAKCGDFASAWRCFERMDRKNPVTWNSMIRGYCQRGDNEEALWLFDEMRARGIQPSLVTWNILITSCIESGDVSRAMELMRAVRRSGLVPDLITWTTMICGLTRNNCMLQALELLQEMWLEGIEPNGKTFAGALSACASLKTLERGMEIHSLSVRLGYSNNVLVDNALIDFYGKCARVDDAERIFGRMYRRDVFSYNSMIRCYMLSGCFGKAHVLFSKMEDMGVKRNTITWNVMISGHFQNGDEDRAMHLFQAMEAEGVGRNTASWNSLIAGSLHIRNRRAALQIFRLMQTYHCKPNRVTILSILQACENLVSDQHLKEIHACVLRRGLHFDVRISNSLINSYAKCGDIISSQILFDSVSFRDTITWNSLISGYLLHKRPEIVLDLFDSMIKGKEKPDHITLAGLISAYGMLGMVNEAMNIFSSMTANYGIRLGQDHYSAMVDVFGRSGRLSEAMDLIEKMPTMPDSTIWSNILCASRIYGNELLASHAAKKLVELEPKNIVAQYQLVQLQGLCKNEASKLPRDDENLGCSWLSHLDGVLTFSPGDRSFVDAELVYSKLSDLEEEMERNQMGNISKYLEVEDELSETITGTHSEKLAIAFSLVNPSTRGNIRIVKNIRTCLKCHTAAKYISSAHQSEIMLRDPKCLHHFRNGRCSCDDYW